MKVSEHLEIEDRWLIMVDDGIGKAADETLLISQSYYRKPDGEVVRLRTQADMVGAPVLEVTTKTPEGSGDVERTTFHKVIDYQTIVESMELTKFGITIDKTRSVYHLDGCSMSMDIFHLAPTLAILEFEHSDMSRHGLRTEPRAFIEAVMCQPDRQVAVNITGVQRLSNRSMSEQMVTATLNDILERTFQVDVLLTDIRARVDNRPFAPVMYELDDSMDEILQKVLIVPPPVEEFILDRISLILAQESCDE